MILVKSVSEAHKIPWLDSELYWAIDWEGNYFRSKWIPKYDASKRQWVGEGKPIAKLSAGSPRYGARPGGSEIVKIRIREATYGKELSKTST